VWDLSLLHLFHCEKAGGTQFANPLCYGMNLLWSREVQVKKYRKYIKKDKL
jgi:hypothetical protein